MLTRRKFIGDLTLLTGSLSIAGNQFSLLEEAGEKKLLGRVTCRGKGIPNTVISDGYTVIATDKKGYYELAPHPDANSVFISTPSGYAFKNTNNIARHYHLLSDISKNKRVDFELTRLKQNDDEHRFIIWADPQVKNDKDVHRMMNEAVPDVKKYISSLPSDTLLHGITVGDIVWDELERFADYDKAVAAMGIPFFQCLGNHDMDYRKGGDETSDDTFQKTYGPTYYSFNRGQVHYVVMDNVRYLGQEKAYDGYVQQHQLDWLKKDLSFVPHNKLIVLSVHIPVHSGTKNNTALYEILAGRNVHIMSGHTHYHKNVIRDTIFEHNHGTVCGAWWTGGICEDGTPNGYGVYTVKGNQLSWHYQSTGQEASHQLKTFITPEDDGNKLMQVNIWNHDPEWKTEYWADGVQKGPLYQYEGFDPDAYKKLLGPELPKPRGFAEPKKTAHLFRATIPATAKEVKVRATDRFGNIFETIQKIS